MQIISFIDLDDTILQTRPKCPPGASLQTGALARDGSPLSFTTEQQRRLLKMLDDAGVIIPVTARNRDAFTRVQLKFHSFAVLDFGGVILHPDGSLDEAWDREMRPQVMETADEMHEIHRSIEEFIQTERLGARARVIVDFDMPLYIVIKHPEYDLASLDRIRDEHLRPIPTSRFVIHQNHNNLSVVPLSVGKEKAVRYLLENHFAPALTIGIGDSLGDFPFLELCDFMMIPRGSQLAERLPH